MVLLRQYMSVSHLCSGCASGQEAGDEDHQPYGRHARPEDHESQLGRLNPDKKISIFPQLTRRSILGSDCIDSYFDALSAL